MDLPKDAAWLVPILPIVWLFSRLDAALSDEGRKKMTDLVWYGTPARRAGQWVTSFADLFDRAFGERHLSWKCLWRSAVASAVAVSALMLIYLLRVSGDLIGDPLSAAFYIFVCGLPATILPDFLSLLQTRWFIGRLTPESSIGRAAGVIVLDAIATCAIVTMTTAPLFFIVLMAWLWPHPSDWVEMLSGPDSPITPEAFLSMELPGDETFGDDASVVGLGPIFYSGFLTSVWLWLHVAGLLLARLLRKLDFAQRWLRGVLDVEKHPLKSVGVLIACSYTLIFLVIKVISWAAGGTLGPT